MRFYCCVCEAVLRHRDGSSLTIPKAACFPPSLHSPIPAHSWFIATPAWVGRQRAPQTVLFSSAFGRRVLLWNCRVVLASDSANECCFWLHLAWLSRFFTSQTMLIGVEQSRFPTYRLRPLCVWDHPSRASSQCGGLSFDTRVPSRGISLCYEELTGTRQLPRTPTAHCLQLCLHLRLQLSQLRVHQKTQQTSDYSKVLWEYWSSNHKEHEKIPWSA